MKNVTLVVLAAPLTPAQQTVFYKFYQAKEKELKAAGQDATLAIIVKSSLLIEFLQGENSLQTLPNIKIEVVSDQPAARPAADHLADVIKAITLDGQTTITDIMIVGDSHNYIPVADLQKIAGDNIKLQRINLDTNVTTHTIDLTSATTATPVTNAAPVVTATTTTSEAATTPTSVVTQPTAEKRATVENATPTSSATATSSTDVKSVTIEGSTAATPAPAAGKSSASVSGNRNRGSSLFGKKAPLGLEKLNTKGLEKQDMKELMETSADFKAQVEHTDKSQLQTAMTNLVQFETAAIQIMRKKGVKATKNKDTDKQAKGKICIQCADSLIAAKDKNLGDKIKIISDIIQQNKAILEKQRIQQDKKTTTTTERLKALMTILENVSGTKALLQTKAKAANITLVEYQTTANTAATAVTNAAPAATSNNSPSGSESGSQDNSEESGEEKARTDTATTDATATEPKSPRAPSDMVMGVTASQKEVITDLAKNGSTVAAAANLQTTVPTAVRRSGSVAQEARRPSAPAPARDLPPIPGQQSSVAELLGSSITNAFTPPAEKPPQAPTVAVTPAPAPVTSQADAEDQEIAALKAKLAKKEEIARLKKQLAELEQAQQPGSQITPPGMM